MPEKKKQGGWQANVGFYDNYVIKTPKTKREMIAKIRPYLIAKGKLDELDKRVKDMQEGWKRGLEIISKKSIPPKMLGYPEFLSKGRIKQKKAIILEDVWNDSVDDGNIDYMKEIVDKSIEFIISLWKYGIHETTGKIGYEFGLLENEVILLDFGELTENKNTAEKQIAKKYWENHLAKYCRKEVQDYFNLRASKKLTLSKLNRVWNTAIS